MAFHKSWNKVLTCISMATLMGLMIGCAGPTTPFGAMHILHPFQKKVEIAPPNRKISSIGERQGPTITFSPTRQKFHDRADFGVHIHDPGGFDQEHELQILHNGTDVTSNFLRRARTNFSKAKTQMNLRFTHLRLRPDREHKIEVLYWRSRWDEPIYSRFLPPVCDPYAPGSIYQLHGFRRAPESYIHLINSMSEEAKLNPYYMAGLIAQESGFDPKAVSWAKAIGLTQITPIAEKELMRDTPDGFPWPRYPEINDMPVPTLKALIMAGTINSQREWRLNPRYSIRGGISYLQYLANYWQLPQNSEILSKIDGDRGVLFSKVLLASYNSGASRVGNAMKRTGNDWLAQRELSEARKYVNRIFSYCHHFAEEEKNNADET